MAHPTRRLPAPVIGAILGCLVWGFALAGALITYNGWFKLAAFPFAILGWVYIWGDNGPPYQWMSGWLFNVTLPLVIYTACGLALGTVVGSLARARRKRRIRAGLCGGAATTCAPPPRPAPSAAPNHQARSVNPSGSDTLSRIAAMAMHIDEAEAFPCPCCGYLQFDEPPGSYGICSICFWEDDRVQLIFPDLAGGANKCTLIEGQRNFAEFGACERAMLPHVQQATTEVRDWEWRPLDLLRDRFLRWGSESDHKLWDKKRHNTSLCLYYWRPEYWLFKEQL